MFMTWIFATSQSFSFLFARFFFVFCLKASQTIQSVYFKNVINKERLTANYLALMYQPIKTATLQCWQQRLCLLMLLLIVYLIHILFNFKRSCVYIFISRQKWRCEGVSLGCVMWIDLEIFINFAWIYISNYLRRPTFLRLRLVAHRPHQRPPLPHSPKKIDSIQFAQSY